MSSRSVRGDFAKQKMDPKWCWDTLIPDQESCTSRLSPRLANAFVSVCSSAHGPCQCLASRTPIAVHCLQLDGDGRYTCRESRLF